MTDPFVIGFGGLAALVTLIALRMPIAYAMILVGGIGVSLLDGPGVLLSQLKTLAYGQFSIYDLSVVPMFVLMGALASASGLSASLFRGANAWFGRFRGGTAMAAIAACAGFGAVCGSSLATASTMGKVALPELRVARRYYSKLGTANLHTALGSATYSNLTNLVLCFLGLALFAILASFGVILTWD